MRLDGLSLEDLPVPLVFSAYRIIRDCNRQFAELFGYGREELVDQSFHRLYPELSGFVLTGELWRTNLAGGSVYTDQRIMQKRDGTRFWAEARGRSKHPEDPFAEAIYCFEPMARAVGPDKALTGRRLQIVALVAQGKTNAVIADEVGLSRRTVEAHRARTMKALGLRNGAELVAWFHEQRG